MSRLKAYLVIDGFQSLFRGLDLMCTSLKYAGRYMIGFIFSAIEHRLLVEVLFTDPLQWYSFRGAVAGDAEVVAALDLELEAVPHITGSVH